MAGFFRAPAEALNSIAAALDLPAQRSTMTKYKLEYIWLDGKRPVPELRGKTLLKAFERPPALADLPNWGFDGSSTMQAEGKSSDCVLKHVALYPDASRKDAYIVLSEVLPADGTPHSTNARATIENTR